MKKLSLLILLLIFASCSKDCDTMEAEIYQDYYEALKGTNGNLEAVRELQRQRDKRLANLDC